MSGIWLDFQNKLLLKKQWILGGLQRTVVQSVFPSLDVPIISTNKSSLSLLSDEDVIQDFNFEEIIILNEAISTRNKLKDFQMCKFVNMTMNTRTVNVFF